MIRNKKIIAFLITLCLMIQIFPGFINYSDHIQNSSHGKCKFLKIVAIRDGIPYIVRDNLNAIKHLAHNRNDLAGLNNYPDINHSLADLSAFKISIDYRKNIRQCIPLYFNGSKYKNQYLVG